MKENIDKRKLIKWKGVFITGIAIVSVLAYLIILVRLLRTEAVQKQDKNNLRFFSSTLTNLNSNESEISSLIENYHANNTMMLNDLVVGYSGYNYVELRSLPIDDQSKMLFNATQYMADCVWLLIVERDGDVVVSDVQENIGYNILKDSKTEIPEKEYYDLCDGKVGYLTVDNPFKDSEQYPGEMLYLYCKPIPGSYDQDGQKFFFLAFSSYIVDKMEDNMEDLSLWVNDSTIGNNGEAFIVDADTDTVRYGTFLGNDRTGAKASDIGFKPDILVDGYKGMSYIDGKKCYVSVRGYSSKLYGMNEYIVSVVPNSNLFSINASLINWNIFLYIIFLTLVIAYSHYIRCETLNKGEDLHNIRIYKIKEHEVFVSKVLMGKIIPVVLVAAVLLLCFGLYFQTLLELSGSFSETVATEEDIMRSVEQSEDLQTAMKDYYDMEYLSRAELISFIVSIYGDDYLNIDVNEGGVVQYGSVDESGNRNVVRDDYNNTIFVLNDSEDLQRLKEENGADNIFLVSDKGVALATSSKYSNFSLPTDQNDPYYELWDILDGRKDTIIKDDPKIYENLIVRSVACPMYYFTCLDENHNTRYVSYAEYMKQGAGGNDVIRHRGLIRMDVVIGEGEMELDSAKPEYVLSNTRISNDGFLTGYVYDEEEDDYKVFYSQKASLIDEYAKDLNISDKAFSGNYNGFQSFDNDLYLNSFRQGGDYYISTSLPVDALCVGSFKSARNHAVYALIIMLLIAACMICVSDTGEEKLYYQESDPFEVFFHWREHGKWKQSTSSQKFEHIFKNCFIILGIVFLISVLCEWKTAGSNSAILYILSGEWDRRVHIFSISACVVIILAAIIITKIIEYVLCLLAEAFGKRIVTMIRMIISIVRIVAVAIVSLYCLYLIGIDGTSLLASAGIMSVVVGLGAQSLVGDLLAGIFIIMEGAMHVGDYVMINGVRGKVVDIGLRITRYEDDNQNIRIICNNELKNFTNMSVKYSVVIYSIPVPYNEDYPRIKKILNDEFLKLYEENRFLKAIPSCQGIQEFAESSVELRIRFMCEEKDRYPVQWFMYDQIMRILMENDITVPFNQLDIHVDNEFIKES